MKHDEQDKIWNDLSDESKVIIQDEWLKLAIEEEHDDLDMKGAYKKLSLEDVFGKHNITMTREEQDKVLQALEYFRTHATEEQKKEALALLEKECKTDTSFKDYVQFKPITRFFIGINHGTRRIQLQTS